MYLFSFGNVFNFIGKLSTYFRNNNILEQRKGVHCANFEFRTAHLQPSCAGNLDPERVLLLLAAGRRKLGRRDAERPWRNQTRDTPRETTPEHHVVRTREPKFVFYFRNFFCGYRLVPRGASTDSHARSQVA